MIPKIWIGGCDDCIGKRLRKALRVCIAEEDVAARRIVGRKGEQNMFARAVIDFCRLKEQSVGRVEEDRKVLR